MGCATGGVSVLYGLQVGLGPQLLVLFLLSLRAPESWHLFLVPLPSQVPSLSEAQAWLDLSPLHPFGALSFIPSKKPGLLLGRVKQGPQSLLPLSTGWYPGSPTETMAIPEPVLTPSPHEKPDFLSSLNRMS